MKRLRILIAAVLSMSLVATTPMAVFAQDGQDDTTTTTTTSSNSNTTDTTDDKNLTPEQLAQKQAELKKRIEEYKAGLKTKLTDAKSKKIVAKCKLSQVVVRGAETSAKAITENRGKAYSKIAEKIQSIIDKVKAQGIDTSALEAANATAKQKADALTASLETYNQTLADLRAMDCAADPTAFQAALEKARTQRETIKNQAKDLRNYISTTLKQALQDVKKQLQATETETEKPQDDNSTTGGTR